jgi:hypothetical protein
MGWILLEAAVALGLALFIVWFTMGIKRPPPSPPAQAAAPRSPRDDETA